MVPAGCHGDGSAMQPHTILICRQPAWAMNDPPKRCLFWFNFVNYKE